MNYAERRAKLYHPLREAGVFTWDWMYGEEYALASLHTITDEFRREIAQATELLGPIFTKTVDVIQNGDEALFRELGIPPEAYQAVRLSVLQGMPTVVGRFDFAYTPQGLKMLEFNSDTPTSIVEAYYANGHAARFFGAGDPNEGMNRHLQEAFQGVVESYRQFGYPTERIFFSALDWHEEDAGTTRYLLKQSGLQGQFVPLANLRVDEDRMFALVGEEMQPVDLLYRLHALEKLAEDQDTDGYRTGAHILDLVAARKLAIINPPSAFLAQTKALQALIWNLQEEGSSFYTSEEREVIRTYMLPTYMENVFRGRSDFVSKPIFGREGGGVTLYGADGAVMERDREEFYWEQPMIYQELAPLQTLEVETLKGPYAGHLLWGSFLIGGKSSAVVARVGGKITGNLSYFLPVGMR